MFRKREPSLLDTAYKKEDYEIPKTAEGRRNKVTKLFNLIAFLASVEYKSKEHLDEAIRPMVDLLYRITKYQESMGELPDQIYWKGKPH